MSKYALQNEVPSATILNSVDISLETRARARLAGHQFITNAVKSFRNKYPDWKLSIAELMNDLGAKHRAKKKPNEKKSVQVKKKKTTMHINKCVDDQSQSEDSYESDSNETDSIKSDINIEKTKISKVEKPLSIENNAKEKNKSVKSKQVEINVLETEKKSNSLTDNSIDIEVECGEKHLKRKHEHEVSSRIDNKKKRNTDEIKPVCETVDSFFMTTDDKDYMSVYKPPPIVETNITERPKLDYQKPKKEIFIKGKKVILGKQNNMGNRRERRQHQVEEPVDTSLHPSWEAKRKQKSLAKFEGKKITFDQD